MLISDILYSTLRAVLAYEFERINILQGGCQYSGVDLDLKVTVTQWQRSKQALLMILGIDHVIGH